MSLAQKYTWADFLKTKPEFKGKRTSSEGKKAYEVAYKAFAKEYLKGRLDNQKKAQEAIATKRVALVEKVKGAKTGPAAKVIQKKVGRKEKAALRIGKAVERTQAFQKSL